MWLYLTFDDIEERLEFNREDIAAISITLARNVEEAYTAILDKSEKPERARKLLNIILATRRPLTLDEVNVAMHVEEHCISYNSLELWPPHECESIIKNMCGLFLSVVDSKVYLIHQTAKEFLTSQADSPATSPPQAFSPLAWKHSFCSAKSDLQLAKVCIWFLQFQEFEDRKLESEHESTKVEESFYDDKLRDDEVRPDSGDELEGDDSRIHDEVYDESKHDKPDESEADYSSQISHRQDSDSDLDSERRLAELNVVIEQKTIYFLAEYHFLDYAASYWRKHFSGAGTLPDASLLAMAAHKLCDSSSQIFKVWNFIDYGLESFMYHDRSISGYCNLLVGAYHHLFQVVKLLLEEGFDPNIQDLEGYTPLYWAAFSGDEAMAKLLLENSAMVNPTRSGAELPIHGAALEGREAMVKLLLENGAEVNSRDSAGKSALFQAATNAHEAVARLLFEYGAEADVVDCWGDTPLSTARKRLLEILPGDSPSRKEFENVIMLLEQYQGAENLSEKAGETVSNPSFTPDHLDSRDPEVSDRSGIESS